MLFILVFFAVGLLVIGFILGLLAHDRLFSPDNASPTIDPTILHKFPEVAQGIPTEQEMKERHEWGEETKKRLFRAHNSY